MKEAIRRRLQRRDHAASLSVLDGCDPSPTSEGLVVTGALALKMRAAPPFAIRPLIPGRLFPHISHETKFRTIFFDGLRVPSSDSEVLVVQPADERMKHDPPDRLNRTRRRRTLVEKTQAHLC